MIRLAALALAAFAAAGQTFDIKPASGSAVRLEVYKTGLLSGKKHVFVFERFQGQLRYDAAAPERSTVEFTVDAASIQCKDDWVSESDLKKVMSTATGPEMLDVSKYPRLRFASSSAVKRADGGFDVSGSLTIRDVTRPVTVVVTMKPRGDASIEFAGKSEVKLKDFGLRPPTAVLGAIGTRNEMPVEFAITAVKR